MATTLASSRAVLRACGSASPRCQETESVMVPRTRGAFTSFSGLRADRLPRVRVARTQRVAAMPSRAVAMAAATAVSTKFTTLKPLADRVLIKVSKAEEKTSGGILLPSSSQNRPQGGEVVAVGEGKTAGSKKIPVTVEVGARVVYAKYAGTEVEFNNEDHLLLKEDDIIGLMVSDDVKDLKPLNDRVLIKVTEAEDKTAGGVLLTDSAKERPQIGSVVAVGQGSLDEEGKRKPIEIAVGADILYAKYAGQEFKSADETAFVVLRSQDVMAVLS